MADAPNYGFHRSPRFSVNHVAEYITAETAGQREAVIRSAKFPRKPAVVPYTISRRIIKRFLASNSGDTSQLDDDLRRLDAQLRHEPDGWMKGEFRRNIDALEAFKKAFVRSRGKRYRFFAGAADADMRVEKVLINVRLDVGLTETDNEGVTNSGGCVLFVAGTDGARKKIGERSKIVAALIFWGLERSAGNIEPLERLCMSFDVFGGQITKAPKAIDRLRTNVTSACNEAAAHSAFSFAV